MTGRIERLVKEFDIEIRWTAFPLHPETPTQGRSLEELFAGRPINIPQMLDRLKKTAQELELPFGDREYTYNSRLAQELGKWAESMGKGEEFHNAAFRSYFEKGQNIAMSSVLSEIAETSGLSGEDALDIIEKRTFKQAVDDDWERSRIKGITAVPTFLIEDRYLPGAQPYAVLEKLMESFNIRRRSDSIEKGKSQLTN